MKNKPQNTQSLSRRQLIKLFGTGVATYGLFGASAFADSKTTAHIVIIGGGIGGAASAKYLRLLNKDVKITIIEPNPEYIFCPGSNEIIPGWSTLEESTFNYETIKSRYQVNLIHDKASLIDYDKKQVKTAKGDIIKYDKLIVSPGPSFHYEGIEGFNQQLAEGEFPAAWKAGKQTLKLRQQLLAMKQGGTVLISVPADPYRCPPAPYERASFISTMLKKINPTAKVIILDNKNSFIFDNNFPYYWKQHFAYGTPKSTLEWVSKDMGGEVVSLDAKNRNLITADGTVHHGDVINIIPPEKAGQFALDNDLAEGDWCPVEFKDFSSTKHKDVYVIGDSVDGDPMPKTGFLASNQARVVVQAINDELHGKEIGMPFLINGCVAMAGEDYGMTLSETFRFQGLGKPLAERYFIPEPTTNPEKQLVLANMARNWQRTFRKDIFS